MSLFIEILTQVTLPIISLVALGWLLQPRLKLDVGSLNRLQVYVVMPAFLVHFLSTGKQPLAGSHPQARTCSELALDRPPSRVFNRDGAITHVCAKASRTDSSSRLWPHAVYLATAA